MVKVLKTNACSDQEDPILAVIDMLRFGEDMLADMYSTLEVAGSRRPSQS